MSHIATQHFSFSELQVHPSHVINLLSQDREIALVIKRDNDEITVCSYPVYSQEVHDILAEAIAEHQALKQQGYDNEKAFQGFRESQEEMRTYFEKTC